MLFTKTWLSLLPWLLLCLRDTVSPVRSCFVPLSKRRKQEFRYLVVDLKMESYNLWIPKGLTLVCSIPANNTAAGLLALAPWSGPLPILLLVCRFVLLCFTWAPSGEHTFFPCKASAWDVLPFPWASAQTTGLAGTVLVSTDWLPEKKKQAGFGHSAVLRSLNNFWPCIPIPYDHHLWQSRVCLNFLDQH